jgi:hypothetical protein
MGGNNIMIRGRNKTISQKEREATTKIKQNQYNTISLQELQEKNSRLKGCDADILDKIYFERKVINGTDEDEDSIESLMMPSHLQSLGGTGTQSVTTLLRKVDKMFECEKYQVQARYLSLYTDAKMSIVDIERYTRPEEVTEADTQKIHARYNSIQRSIKTGIERIQRKLSPEEWNKVKYRFNVKC